jgi:hypothetical protein
MPRSSGAMPTAGPQAAGFPGKMLPNQGSGVISAQAQSDCEILGDCEDEALAAAIR